LAHPSTEFILTSKRVVTSDGVKEVLVHVRDGVIVDILSLHNIPDGIIVEDYGDLVIMPGLVDTHVHINEPGRTEWEGFETATQAAAAGGVTTLVDMPLNSSPVTTSVDAFNKKLEAANGKLWVDCGFYTGLVPGNADQIHSLIEAGVLGVKAFLIHSGIDEFPNAGEGDLRAAMPVIAAAGVPLLVHAELSSNAPSPNNPGQDPRSYSAYLASRPRPWEHDAITLMISLCREFNCRTHIVHLSSADAVPMLRVAREEGLPLPVETCPHYLFFSAEEIPDSDTRFKCAPPIREEENRQRLWTALKERDIDFIVSDHSPCPPYMKMLESGDFMRAWGGIASLQFGLSIIWTEAQRRGFSIQDVAEWMCRRPAQFVGLGSRKGAIASGCDADFVLWNPEGEFTVKSSNILHRHKITPYEGRSLYGVVEKTILHGRTVYEHGSVSPTPSGSTMLRTSTSFDTA